MKIAFRTSLFLSLLFGLLSFAAEAKTGKEKNFKSQVGQDAYVNKHFFKGKRNGIFVDIGAHNGMTFSNTCFFEKTLDWSGICVEPMPEIFAQLKKNRPHSICIEGCISNKYENANFMRIHSPVVGAEMLSGIVENYDPRHLERIKKTIKQKGGSFEIIPVACYNLMTLLQENHLFHIDYLSLDTEGGELDILKSIDFDAVQIDVISVENAYKDPKFKSFLESKGYELVKTFHEFDQLYKKTGVY